MRFRKKGKNVTSSTLAAIALFSCLGVSVNSQAASEIEKVDHQLTFEERLSEASQKTSELQEKVVSTMFLLGDDYQYEIPDNLNNLVQVFNEAHHLFVSLKNDFGEDEEKNEEISRLLDYFKPWGKRVMIWLRLKERTEKAGQRDVPRERWI